MEDSTGTQNYVSVEHEQCQREITLLRNRLYAAEDKRDHYKEQLRGHNMISEQFARVFARLSTLYPNKVELRYGCIIVNVISVTCDGHRYQFKLCVTDETIEIDTKYNVKVLFAHAQLLIDELGFNDEGKNVTNVLDIISQITTLRSYLITTQDRFAPTIQQFAALQHCRHEIPAFYEIGV